MTITLYLQKETLIRDLQTLKIILGFTIEAMEKLRTLYEPLNISSSEWNPKHNVTIQVTPEEFALIGVFNGGI